MTISVEVDNRSGWTIDEPAVVSVLSTTLHAEGVREAELGVRFVVPDEIAGLNGAHRGKPTPTDVLSFPIDALEGLPQGVPRLLGDLVVCPKVAADRGTRLELLLVHGVLHLLGYDHEVDGGAMLARQEVLAAEVRGVAAEPA